VDTVVLPICISCLSAKANRWNRVGWVSFVVVFAILILRPTGLAQTRKAPAPSPGAPKVRQHATPTLDLDARKKALESAKHSGDVRGINAASRQVVSFAMRQLGEVRLSHASAQAAVVLRRSLDFEDAPETRLALASAYLLNGKTDEGLSEVTNLLVSNPQNAPAWRVQGQAWLSKKNYRQAAESLMRSADLQPDAYTSYLLGVALLHQKQKDQASTTFSKALRAGGNRAALHAFFSDAYRCAQYFDEAASELKQASTLDPKSSRAHFRLALLALARNEWTITPTARTEFQKEVQLNPGDFYGTFALGLAEFFDQRYSQSEAYFRTAVSSHPNWPEPWLYLGLAAYNRGDQKSAEENLRKAIALTHSNARGNYQIRRVYYTLGRLLTEQNRKDEAAEFVSRFRQAQSEMLLEVQRTPGTMGGGMAQMSLSASAFSALAQIQTEAATLAPAGSDPAAWLDLRNRPSTERDAIEARERELRRILSSALNDLGAAGARQEQFTAALGHFHEAEQWNSETPGLMRNMGMAAARISDYKETVRALRPVLAADPSDTVARSMLGLALFATDDYRGATEVFAPLGDSVLERPELAYAWASSLVKINQFPQAASLLEKMQQRHLSPETLILVAQTWSQMGNYPKTVEACHQALSTEPTLQRAHYIAGLALIHQDRPAEAAQEFRSELRLQPDAVDSQFHLAFTLLQLSQNEEAVQWLRRVLANNPEHPEANYELGKQLMGDGKPADAIPYLEAAVRLKPLFEPGHYQLQSAYRAVGRKEDADREARIYKELKAKSRNITLPPPREQSSQTSRPDKP
jgi:tetratricopeptide (TPR) repeat protein